MQCHTRIHAHARTQQEIHVRRQQLVHVGDESDRRCRRGEHGSTRVNAALLKWQIRIPREDRNVREYVAEDLSGNIDQIVAKRGRLCRRLSVVQLHGAVHV